MQLVPAMGKEEADALYERLLHTPLDEIDSIWEASPLGKDPQLNQAMEEIAKRGFELEQRQQQREGR